LESGWNAALDRAASIVAAQSYPARQGTGTAVNQVIERILALKTKGDENGKKMENVAGQGSGSLSGEQGTQALPQDSSAGPQQSHERLDSGGLSAPEGTTSVHEAPGRSALDSTQTVEQAANEYTENVREQCRDGHGELTLYASDIRRAYLAGAAKAPTDHQECDENSKAYRAYIAHLEKQIVDLKAGASAPAAAKPYCPHCGTQFTFYDCGGCKALVEIADVARPDSAKGEPDGQQ
jgi:hypothetical protein